MIRGRGKMGGREAKIKLPQEPLLKIGEQQGQDRLRSFPAIDMPKKSVKFPAVS